MLRAFVVVVGVQGALTVVVAVFLLLRVIVNDNYMLAVFGALLLLWGLYGMYCGILALLPPSEARIRHMIRILAIAVWLLLTAGLNTLIGARMPEGSELGLSVVTGIIVVSLYYSVLKRFMSACKE